MSPTRFRLFNILAVFFVASFNSSWLFGQSTTTPSAPVQIGDQPTSIDPHIIFHPKLSLRVTKEFSETPLTTVASWLSEQTGFTVIIDELSLQGNQVLTSDPITDRLDDTPIYQLLDRLANLGIGWKLEGEVLYLRAIQNDELAYSEQYNIGDLLDNGYNGDELQYLASELRHLEKENDDETAVDLLGDMLFVRNRKVTHRRIGCLFQALRQPSRRVLVDDPQEHQRIREALNTPISVRFQGEPLISTTKTLSQLSNIDIRVDEIALTKHKISIRVPVILEIREQRLRTIIDAIASQHQITTLIRDGVLWLTTTEEASKVCKIAVFDVRDLCINAQECQALREAIQRQITPEEWLDGDGRHLIAFPKTGIMVVTQSEDPLDELLQLLDRYRQALRSSKRRDIPKNDPDAIEIRYYRLPTEVADDLLKTLPELLAKDTWQTAENKTNPGTIRSLRSWSEVREKSTLQSYSVLVIQQKRAVHDEIGKLIGKVRNGDAADPMMTGMMGSGMGGMGGMDAAPSGRGIGFGSAIAPF